MGTPVGGHLGHGCCTLAWPLHAPAGRGTTGRPGTLSQNGAGPWPRARGHSCDSWGGSGGALPGVTWSILAWRPQGPGRWIRQGGCPGSSRWEACRVLRPAVPPGGLVWGEGTATSGKTSGRGWLPVTGSWQTCHLTERPLALEAPLCFRCCPIAPGSQDAELQSPGKCGCVRPQA